MKTVAFILPSLAGGGAERVMLSLAAGLDRERFRVVLILLTDAGPLAPLVAPDIEVAVLQRPRLRTALPALRATLARIRPDFAVATMAYLNMGLLALRPFLPRTLRYVVREANTPKAASGAGIGSRLHRHGYRRLYRHAHCVITPAEFIRKELLALGVPEDRLRVLYNPVNVTGLRDRGTPAERLPGEGRRFVAAGRLTEQKGFDRLVAMAAELEASDRISVFGDGPSRASLEEQVLALNVGERICFQDYTDRLPAWIAGADALLLPSRWEGLPNVALEALALGTPVIATLEAGGIGEIQALAGPGEVLLAPAGQAFVAEMKACAPRPDGAPRDSRLPPAFSLEKAVADFETIVAS